MLAFYVALVVALVFLPVAYLIYLSYKDLEQKARPSGGEPEDTTFPKGNTIPDRGDAPPPEDTVSEDPVASPAKEINPLKVPADLPLDEIRYGSILKREGIETAGDLATLNGLTEVDGIGEKRAQAIREDLEEAGIAIL